MSEIESETQARKTIDANKGLLGWIERSGNALPDPVFIFVWLIALLAALSAVCALSGLSALHPVALDDNGDPVVVKAMSIFAPDNIRRLLVEMPRTFTHFHPLGYVLVVMLGAGVAERCGLFAAAMSAAVKNAPRSLLTPVVAIVGMMGNQAADAAYVVLLPLSAVLYAAAGRHPIAGLATAFAAVSGGFSANLLPGQLDALLFGITEAAVESLIPFWDANISGNWYFMAAMTIIYTPVIWFVTDRIIEPRLGPWTRGATSSATSPLSAQGDEKQGRALAAAGIAALSVIVLWVFLTIGPGTPLIDESAKPEAQLNPFYRSLVAGFFVLFIASAWAYGAVTGTIASHRDLVGMMSEAMSDLAYYLVLAFAAAHFVAIFNWSNLGLIFAINGADVLSKLDMPAPLLLAVMVIVAGVANLFIGSASAKWALLAPVLVPMLMLLGVSPEMTTAAYRVGDSATNIVTPLMVYFPLGLAFAQKWDKNFGLGSLMATMIPYSIWLLGAGLAMTIGWVALDLPLGPGAGAGFALPGP